MVRGNDKPPTIVDEGEREVMAGTGLEKVLVKVQITVWVGLKVIAVGEFPLLQLDVVDQPATGAWATE
jgi:hypothetical protein